MKEYLKVVTTPYGNLIYGARNYREGDEYFVTPTRTCNYSEDDSKPYYEEESEEAIMQSIFEKISMGEYIPPSEEVKFLYDNFKRNMFIGRLKAHIKVVSNVTCYCWFEREFSGYSNVLVSQLNVDDKCYCAGIKESINMPGKGYTFVSPVKDSNAAELMEAISSYLVDSKPVNTKLLICALTHWSAYAVSRNIGACVLITPLGYLTIGYFKFNNPSNAISIGEYSKIERYTIDALKEVTFLEQIGQNIEPAVVATFDTVEDYLMKWDQKRK